MLLNNLAFWRQKRAQIQSFAPFFVFFISDLQLYSLFYIFFNIMLVFTYPISMFDLGLKSDVLAGGMVVFG